MEPKVELTATIKLDHVVYEALRRHAKYKKVALRDYISMMLEEVHKKWVGDIPKYD
jgi:hypothetical protein